MEGLEGLVWMAYTLRRSFRIHNGIGNRNMIASSFAKALSQVRSACYLRS
jgi:hypothetical protein